MNSKCGVQSKRKCGSHESCVCIVGFPACGCQKKSVVEYIHNNNSLILEAGWKQLETLGEIKDIEKGEP